MKQSTKRILEALRESNAGDGTVYRRKEIHAIAEELGYPISAYVPLLTNQLKRGVYDLAEHLGDREANLAVTATELDEDVYIPEADDTYVAWGYHSDIKKAVESRQFFPIYIAGYSGNGKTMMVEQICSALKREYIRVQISPETDEHDLIGGFRLENGNTVFSEGPVIKAMRAGAVLLIDELDRSTHKIMCLQGVLEGKPILLKKTGEVVKPAPGFTVIATANTKGRGSEDGRYTAATIIDDAFLERFNIVIEQDFPTRAIEAKIVMKHMQRFDCVDEDFTEKLVTWTEAIRKTFAEGGVDEIISTRRLGHIVQTYSIFGDRKKAIALCIARFDEEITESFSDLYTKIDNEQ